MRYLFKCQNDKCKLHDKEIIINIPMSELNLPKLCIECKLPQQRVYTSPGIKTFGDGYKA